MSHKIKDPHHSHVVAVVIYKLLAWTRSKQYLAFAPGSLYLNFVSSKSQNIHGFWARDLEKLGRIRSTDSYGYLENTPTHAAHMRTHSHQHTHTLTRTAIYFRRLGFERIPQTITTAAATTANSRPPRWKTIKIIVLNYVDWDPVWKHYGIRSGHKSGVSNKTRSWLNGAKPVRRNKHSFG